ncbi:MAG: hypothetical protein IJU37_07305 [Desulfovibrio sp.]|nr:hypothetical protein [Desulfovibrio sp.]
MSERVFTQLPEAIADPLAILNPSVFNRDYQAKVQAGDIVFVVGLRDDNGSMVVVPLTIEKADGNLSLPCARESIVPGQAACCASWMALTGPCNSFGRTRRFMTPCFGRCANRARHRMRSCSRWWTSLPATRSNHGSSSTTPGPTSARSTAGRRRTMIPTRLRPIRRDGRSLSLTAWTLIVPYVSVQRNRDNVQNYSYASKMDILPKSSWNIPLHVGQQGHDAAVIQSPMHGQGFGSTLLHRVPNHRHGRINILVGHELRVFDMVHVVH